MRILIATALLGLLVCSAAAQQKSTTPIPMDGAPGPEIVGTLLRSSDTEDTASFSIEIKNTSKETITAVGWQYYLSLPSGNTTVDICVTQTTEGLSLKPGETKIIKAIVHNVLDPTVSTVRPSKIRLMKIAYEGASIWRRKPE